MSNTMDIPSHRPVNDSLEEWRKVPGFPGYEVSNQARVRSYYKSTGQGWTIEEKPQRYLSTPPCGAYRQLALCHDGIRTQFRLHQVVALAWHGPCPEGLEICHTDGDPMNNHASNLRYDTSQGNADDYHRLLCSRTKRLREAYAKGDSIADLCQEYGLSEPGTKQLLHGSKFPEAGGPLFSFRKLSSENVVRMREMRATGITLSVLARFFDIDQSMVSFVTRGKRRTRCGGPYTFRKRNTDGSFRFEVVQR